MFMSGHLSKIRKGDLQNCGILWVRQYSSLLTPRALFRAQFYLWTVGGQRSRRARVPEICYKLR
jgi:hypothetical protein